VWLLSAGLVAVMLVGVCVGIGASLAKSPSRAVPVLSGLVGLAASLWTEWKTNVGEQTFGDYVMTVHQQPAITLLFLVLGVIASVWLPWGATKIAPRAEGT
jgi:hypothetical protein